MNCECVQRVNEKLHAANYNYKVVTSLVFDSKMRADERLAVETAWTNTAKPTKKKPPSVLCTFCPFCGTRAVPERETESE